MDATSPAEKERVHCKPAGATAPLGTVKFRFREIVPPNPTLPEDSAKELVCPNDGTFAKNKQVIARVRVRPRHVIELASSRNTKYQY